MLLSFRTLWLVNDKIEKKCNDEQFTVMALGWSNTAPRSGPDNGDPYKMLKKKENVQTSRQKK